MAKRRARVVQSSPEPQDEDSQGQGQGLGEGPSAAAPLLSSNGSANDCMEGSANSRRGEFVINFNKPELVPPPIPRTDRMLPIPPEPVLTPVIICPKGFKNMKFVNTFTLKFSPPECCGGPREVEILASSLEKFLCSGRINSDTEVFLQRLNEEKETEDILTYKLDLTTSEWAISFPELETVAYLVKPKPASRISSNQIYEIFSADGHSNYFNLGIEMEKTGSSRTPDYVYRILNSNLATVATVIFMSNFKGASVTIDESLWPSQKAVILAAAILMMWELVQDIRRKAAWIQLLVVCCVIFSLVVGILLFYIYQLRRDD